MKFQTKETNSSSRQSPPSGYNEDVCDCSAQESEGVKILVECTKVKPPLSY